MHELSLCEHIVQIVASNAETQSFEQVKIIWLEVGALTGVEQGALQFHFANISRGTLAENARLIIIDSPARAWCCECKMDVLIKEIRDRCPQCDNHSLHILSGEEIMLKRL